MSNSDGASPSAEREGAGGRAAARGRARGRRSARGLGMGLGALIPSSEPEPTPTDARPLDVLFPDLTAGSGRSTVPRGGSARDLLEPRGRLSRSTKVDEDGSASANQSGGLAGTIAEGSGPAEPGASAIVSRETIADAGTAGAKSGTAQGLGEALEGSPVLEGETASVVADELRDHNGKSPGQPGGESLAATEQSSAKFRSSGDAFERAAGFQSPRDVLESAGIEGPKDGLERTAETRETGSPKTLDREASNREWREQVVLHTPSILNPYVPREGEDLYRTEELVEVPGVTFGRIPPNMVIPNISQPRQVFGQEELNQLAQSIAQVGILQPIVVRRITQRMLTNTKNEHQLREALLANPDARYELVMGERRWRAAQIAGLETVPVIVRDTSESDILREALIENIHRVQLNPLEEAAAYGQLMDDFRYTQEQVAERVSKSRSQIANSLRLLSLPPEVQRMLAAGALTAGHARALLSLGSPAQMTALAGRIVAEGLSVRSTEEIVRHGDTKPYTPRVRRAYTPTPRQQRISDALGDRLETNVSISMGAKKGRLLIDFADEEDLARIANALGIDA